VGDIRVGITAGASTPNSKIGEAVQRIFETRDDSSKHRVASTGQT
jgi:4-hydroxy-3-methylbut-2-enyl diphosphate reductase IspH